MKALSREDHAMSIPFHQLELQATPIAAGAAGQVYKGTFCEATIAAKTLFSQMMRSSDLSELIDEMHMLYQVQHPFVVRLLGISTSCTSFAPARLTTWSRRMTTR